MIIILILTVTPTSNKARLAFTCLHNHIAQNVHTTHKRTINEVSRPIWRKAKKCVRMGPPTPTPPPPAVQSIIPPDTGIDLLIKPSNATSNGETGQATRRVPRPDDVRSPPSLISPRQHWMTSEPMGQVGRTVASVTAAGGGDVTSVWQSCAGRSQFVTTRYASVYPLRAAPWWRTATRSPQSAPLTPAGPSFRLRASPRVGPSAPSARPLSLRLPGESRRIVASSHRRKRTRRTARNALNARNESGGHAARLYTSIRCVLPPLLLLLATTCYYYFRTRFYAYACSTS